MVVLADDLQDVARAELDAGLSTRDQLVLVRVVVELSPNVDLRTQTKKKKTHLQDQKYTLHWFSVMNTFPRTCFYLVFNMLTHSVAGTIFFAKYNCRFLRARVEIFSGYRSKEIGNRGQLCAFTVIVF